MRSLVLIQTSEDMWVQDMGILFIYFYFISLLSGPNSQLHLSYHFLWLLTSFYSTLLPKMFEFNSFFIYQGITNIILCEMDFY